MKPPEHTIGVDENGLGPRLGPMVVTGIRLRIDLVRVPNEAQLRRITSRAGIGDSKEACAHGDMSGVEAFVLAMLDRHMDVRPATFTQLVARLGLETSSELQSLCPDGEAPRVCFGEALPLPAFGAGPDADAFDRAMQLRDDGVVLASARVSSACARRLNVARIAGRSRFDLDLDAMVALVRALATADRATEHVAYCGKVGGRKSYSAALERMSALVGVLGERPARSSYRVPGFGEIHFVRDGDATEPAIGLASLLGKYVRELWMRRLNNYWHVAVPESVPASGYHDPVTARLVEATALVRAERGVPDNCFER